jgi:hypothetical protein
MKNISTGTGIALLAGAILAYPIIDRVMPRAEAGATHVAAVVAAATAQVPPEPTIVWYGLTNSNLRSNGSVYEAYTPLLFRAWSDGKVEATNGFIYNGYGICEWSNQVCGGTQQWVVVSNPAQGLTYRSDINFDSKVDGADLSQVLNDWGNAPRQDIPPSTCPLNLINP